MFYIERFLARAKELRGCIPEYTNLQPPEEGQKVLGPATPEFIGFWAALREKIKEVGGACPAFHEKLDELAEDPEKLDELAADPNRMAELEAAFEEHATSHLELEQVREVVWGTLRLEYPELRRKDYVGVALKDGKVVIVYTDSSNNSDIVGALMAAKAASAGAHRLKPGVPYAS